MGRKAEFGAIVEAASAPFALNRRNMHRYKDAALMRMKNIAAFLNIKFFILNICLHKTKGV
jgi:hypothetical protein